MKKLLFACLFLVAIATQAQESSDFKTETIEFIKLTGAGAAFDGAIAQIGYSVPEANKEAYTKEAMATLDALYDKIADLYMEEFTQSEIKELVAFYHTDLGKKLATKQLSLTQKAMMFGQSWGMEVGQIAQKHN
ncbi:hypothetical protein EV196_101652 [Mariniflexile fucanivorans]|uniref:DUF2059 domain-containing protein n=1 Tax=Mariniflexile fucanivorans TaxID=264023 RepID=A0A4V2QET0_9FLAO|nr:DUF2059 domain-containing protein [Mariniflexile fucanivorans]TCL69217.1 hypothetical protein EV196_101652 [Mariniflexile fucanivorans]